MSKIEPLGGKASLGTSPVVEAEKAALEAYVRECESIGIIDSEAKAKAYRAATVRMYPSMAKVFKDHKLDY